MAEQTTQDDNQGGDRSADGKYYHSEGRTNRREDIHIHGIMHDSEMDERVILINAATEEAKEALEEYDVVGKNHGGARELWQEKVQYKVPVPDFESFVDFSTFIEEEKDMAITMDLFVVAKLREEADA
jgi:hypothetical protein